MPLANWSTVLNQGVARRRLFDKSADYDAFVPAPSRIPTNCPTPGLSGSTSRSSLRYPNASGCSVFHAPRKRTEENREENGTHAHVLSNPSMAKMANLFGSLFRWAHRQDENFVTEALVY